MAVTFDKSGTYLLPALATKIMNFKKSPKSLNYGWLLKTK